MLTDFFNRKTLIASGIGFVMCAGFTLLLPQTEDRVITEWRDVEVEVIKEKIIWKRAKQTTTHKTSNNSQRYNRYTEKSPDGTVRLWEQGSLTSQTTEKQNMVEKDEKLQGKESSKSTESTSKTTVIQGSTGRMTLGIGISSKVTLPYNPSLTDLGVIGQVRLGLTPFWGTLSWSYPLSFNIGVIYSW